MLTGTVPPMKPLASQQVQCKSLSLQCRRGQALTGARVDSYGAAAIMLDIDLPCEP